MLGDPVQHYFLVHIPTPAKALLHTLQCNMISVLRKTNHMQEG